MTGIVRLPLAVPGVTVTDLVDCDEPNALPAVRRTV